MNIKKLSLIKSTLFYVFSLSAFTIISVNAHASSGKWVNASSALNGGVGATTIGSAGSACATPGAEGYDSTGQPLVCTENGWTLKKSPLDGSSCTTFPIGTQLQAQAGDFPSMIASAQSVNEMSIKGGTRFVVSKNGWLAPVQPLIGWGALDIPTYINLDPNGITRFNASQPSYSLVNNNVSSALRLDNTAKKIGNNYYIDSKENSFGLHVTVSYNKTNNGTRAYFNTQPYGYSEMYLGACEMVNTTVPDYEKWHKEYSEKCRETVNTVQGAHVIDADLIFPAGTVMNVICDAANGCELCQ
jgi:hypothetical protein